MSHSVIVYFYCLPVGEIFTHKGWQWKKTGDDKAVSFHDGTEYEVETDSGCIIDYDRADELNLEQNDYIHC